jgi:NAD(P)H-flavin reductase
MGAAGFPLLSRHVRVRRTLLGARDADHLLDAGCVRTSCATEDGSRGECGLVTALCRKVDWGEFDHFALCGPLPMMDAVIRLVPEELLDRIQVGTESRMACGYGVCEGCAIPGHGGYLKCCTDGPVIAADRIDWPAWRETAT